MRRKEKKKEKEWEGEGKGRGRKYFGEKYVLRKQWVTS